MNSPSSKPTSKKSRAVRADSAAATPESDLTFEESLAELARIVQQLEQGDLGLTESLACYEQGVNFLKHCYGHLSAAERRIELLKGVDAQGNAITSPFDEGTMSLEEKAAARGARRSAATPSRSSGGSTPVDDAVDDSAGLF